MKSNRCISSGRFRWLFGPLLLVFVACSDEDAKEKRPARDTFGKELFGVLCDRVGAQALREDLTGGSYREVCHGSADTVDISLLPPAADPDVRERAIAKVEALARHRVDLIAALDVVFPDDTVVGKNLGASDPAASCDPKSGTPRREQLRGLLSRLLPTETDTIPASSRALARSVEPLFAPEGSAARTALMRVAARRGYMPPDLATGLVGAVLTAPRLRDTLGATMHLFSPDSVPYETPNTVGVGYPALKRFIGAVQADLAEPVDNDAPLRITADPESGRMVLSRPRTTLELVREVMLAENPAFSSGGDPLFVVRRDARGLAAIGKLKGQVPAPFLDGNNDGLPDIDTTGRFALKSGAPIPKDPFVGDDRNDVYEYIDTRKTAASALLRHVAPLSDPDAGGESLFASLEALEPLLRPGGREALLDLVYAGSQVAADSGTDEALALVARLFEKEPQLMARVAGNLLDAKATLDAHPEAELPPGSTLVDDVLDVVVKMSKQPGLLEDVLASMGDERSNLLTKALPPLFAFKDRLTYDRRAINGLPVNTTTGGGAPETLVDRTQPNRGWNRSLWQRFLGMISDSAGVTACNKDGAILHSVISLDGGQTYQEIPFPFGAPDVTSPECDLLKIESLSKFYLRAIVGEAKLHIRREELAPLVSPAVYLRSTGIDGFWPWTAPPDGKMPEDVRPRPQFLNRLVFFDVVGDSPNPSDMNYRTNLAIRDLQGLHIPSAACTARSIPDPHACPVASECPDVGTDGMVHGLRTCSDGQYLDQRNADTIFAFEYNQGYEAMTPLTAVFVKHKQEDLLLELLGALNKHWSVEGGVAKAEPALAAIVASDLIPSLGQLTRAMSGMTVKRCAATSKTTCEGAHDVPATAVLADGLRAIIDPGIAAQTGLVDRRGKATTAAGKPLTLFGLLRDALNAEEAVLDKTPEKKAQWLKARSRIVDEFLTVKGRGPDAAFVDPGVPQIVPVIVDLLRSQRLAKCKGNALCPALRQDVAKDVEASLSKPVFLAGLDVVDVVLNDATTRREIGRLVSYMTRQEAALGGVQSSASSRPFATAKARAPGALDQSIAATVDALGALGDLREIRPFYPVLSRALDDLDPQLALLSRINARAFDDAGHEICSKELDPEETIRNTLARLSLTVKPAGQAKRSALQIFMEVIADVNRVDGAVEGYLDGDDYAKVFQNVHELLTDPKSGLEQLYASVKQAAEN